MSLSLEEMLSFITTVCEQGINPTEWKHAVVVPILKPGKDVDSPGSYL